MPTACSYPLLTKETRPAHRLRQFSTNCARKKSLIPEVAFLRIKELLSAYEKKNLALFGILAILTRMFFLVGFDHTNILC
jgi:hypothetical protein